MGKSTKARKHADKMKKRRAEKAAKRALYASLAGTSKKKKKQAKKSIFGGSGHKHAHAIANCGNIGCQKCYPRAYVKGNGTLSTAA
jgi:hypothetical protein